MILIKQYAKDKWEKFWKEKLGIKGYFNIQIQSLETNLRSKSFYLIIDRRQHNLPTSAILFLMDTGAIT